MDGYDYIVVGGGTAGCVMAARLSEDADARVLLLEAGARKPLEALPPDWLSLQGTSADWAGTSVVQAATGTRIPWPRGRGLGGSSAINGMAFVRGHRSSYDAWVGAGAEGWGFDDLLPYLRRSEHAEGRDPALRGVGGPLTVSPPSSPHPVSAGLRVARAIGSAAALGVWRGAEVLPGPQVKDGDDDCVRAYLYGSVFDFLCLSEDFRQVGSVWPFSRGVRSSR